MNTLRHWAFTLNFLLTGLMDYYRIIPINPYPVNSKPLPGRARTKRILTVPVAVPQLFTFLSHFFYRSVAALRLLITVELVNN
jgi:hypothetical protein